MKKSILISVFLLCSLFASNSFAAQCSGAPVAGTISSITADTLCSGEIGILKLNSFTADSGIHFQWQRMPLGTTLWLNAGGDDSSSTLNFFSSGISANYRCYVICDNSGLSDTSVLYTIYSPGMISVDGDTVCAPGNITLIANSIGSVNWYADNTTSTILQTGNTLNATIAGDSVFYSESDYYNKWSVGPPNNSLSANGQFNSTNSARGLYFTAHSDFVLDTVYIYPGSAGSVKIYLVDTATSITVDSTIFTITASMLNLKTPVPLFWNVTGGLNYFMSAKAAVTGTMNLWRSNAGAVYPYTAYHVVSITGSNAGTPGYYYYFYDWRIHRACASSRVANPVVIGTLTITASTSADSVCIGNNVTLTATGASSYVWNPGGMIGNIVTFAPADTDTFTVVGSVGTGCADSASVIVLVNLPSVVSAFASTDTVCASGLVELTSTGAITYVWTPGNVANDTVYINPLNTTTYTVTGTNASGCTDTDTMVITVDVVPVIGVSTPYSICNGDSAQLSASGGLTYVWQPGGISGNTFFVYPTATTVYTVTAINANSCTGTDTARVQVQTVTINVNTSSDTICPGDSAQLTAFGAFNLTWMPGGMSGGSIYVSPSTTTTFTVTGNNMAGCLGSATILETIGVLPGAGFSFTNSGSTYMFSNTSSNGNTYQWNFGDSIYSFSVNPTYSFSANGTYVVLLTVTNECGTDTISKTIEITGLDVGSVEDESLFSLSPNPTTGTFQISGFSLPVENFQITNVLGEIVFAMQPTNHMPVTINLSNHPEGIYFLSVKTSKGTATRKLVKLE